MTEMRADRSHWFVIPSHVASTRAACQVVRHPSYLVFENNHGRPLLAREQDTVSAIRAVHWSETPQNRPSSGLLANAMTRGLAMALLDVDLRDLPWGLGSATSWHEPRKTSEQVFEKAGYLFIRTFALRRSVDLHTSLSAAIRPMSVVHVCSTSNQAG